MGGLLRSGFLLLWTPLCAVLHHFLVLQPSHGSHSTDSDTGASSASESAALIPETVAPGFRSTGSGTETGSDFRYSGCHSTGSDTGAVRLSGILQFDFHSTDFGSDTWNDSDSGMAGSVLRF